MAKSPEEKLMDAIEEEVEDEELPFGELTGRRERTRRQHKAVIDNFLGKGGRADAVAIVPCYYGELLTWALNRHMANEGWKIIQTLGYFKPGPIYTDVDTGCGIERKEHLLINGQMLLQRGRVRFLVRIHIDPSWRGSVHVEGTAGQAKAVKRFVEAVKTIVMEENFYRGRKLEFTGKLVFVDVQTRSWDSIILDETVKSAICSNTVDFLNDTQRWAVYGIPLKRGILLHGNPGTGKTAICKALLGEAKGITSIIANADVLEADHYISSLYDVAQDLSPSMVIIEDIDLIGQNRMRFGYHRGPALLSLLAALDGIEERDQVVTVATTNFLASLDSALSQRPSRFDRVIEIPNPTLKQRRELVANLCRKIPLDDFARDRITRKTEGCSPAQVQGIIFNLSVENSPHSEMESPAILRFSRDDIDHAVANVKGRNGNPLGFRAPNNGNGRKCNLEKTLRLDQREGQESEYLNIFGA